MQHLPLLFILFVNCTLFAINEVESESLTPETISTVSDSIRLTYKKGVLYTIQLKNGNEISGFFIHEEENRLTFSIESLGELTLDKNAIESLKEDKDSYVGKEGLRYYREPSRTHYFFTPSAFMLNKGDHKFSQLQLAVSEFAFGVTDNITLEFGTALPFWFLGVEAANFLYAVKAGGSPLDNLHIAGGIKGFIIPSFSGGLHLPFLTLTTGTPNRHASLSVSPVVDSEFNIGELTWISLSGLYRMKRNSSLISENWIMLGDKNLTLISGMGIRIFGKRFSADVGGFFFLSDGIGMPLPWLTFSWSIGKGR